MERLNDALRRLIDRLIAVTSGVLHGAVLIRIRTFRFHQARLRRKLQIVPSTPVRGYDEETIQNIERSARMHTTYVQTSGSTREPKRIAYDSGRLRSTLLVFLSAICRILTFEMRKNRTFFAMAPIRSDGSLTALMLKRRIVPEYLCGLQAPHCIQDDPAIQKAANQYGDAAIWLWLLTIANPGLIYATNPSTIATFLNGLSSDWTVISRFTRDYVQGQVDDQALQRIHASYCFARRTRAFGANRCQRQYDAGAHSVARLARLFMLGWRLHEFVRRTDSQVPSGGSVQSCADVFDVHGDRRNRARTG